MSRTPPTLALQSVARLWLHRQGLSEPRGSHRLTKRRFVDHLERVGGLQLDSINVVERAHYLTLWSRFGAYSKAAVDRWAYEDRAAYEYWGHEASLLPISHLPLGRRRMRRFPPPSWKNRSWWSVYSTTAASKRRVLRRLRSEGPLESGDFERQPGEAKSPATTMPLPKEDKRSLKLLWHDGRVAVRTRRHFRCVYDLAERVYPETPVASVAQYEDSWLLQGLSGNGVASPEHLRGYVTGPDLTAADRARVLARNLKAGTVIPVRVEGLRGSFHALPEHLEGIDELPRPSGTHLVCPFDSLLWQRKRAEALLGFRYRIEIYVPAKKREFGYYVLPILHDGRLVGRLDPKLHRDRGELEVKSLFLEPGFKGDPKFWTGLTEALHGLCSFVGGERLEVPRDLRRRIG